MVVEAEKTAGLLMKSGATTDTLNFTEEEIDFLITSLNDLLKEESLSTIEKELTEFLIKQLNKLQVKRKKSKSEKGQELKNLLKTKLGERIIINLAWGGNKSKITGVLCNLALDYISLLTGEQQIKVKLDAIVTVKQQTDMRFINKGEAAKSKQSTEADSQYSITKGRREFKQKKEELTPQQEAEEVKLDVDREQDSAIKEKEESKIRKRKKSYTEVETKKETD